MDTDKGQENEEVSYEEKKEVTPEFDRKMEFTASHLDEVKETSSHITEIMLSRKAYMAVKDLNSNPEMSHIIEQAHHTGNDQRHHLKVPEALISVAHHVLSEIIRKINMSMKKGRCKYGDITRKNLIHCMSKLHG